MTREAWGSGSLFQRKDGKWVLQVYVAGKARQFYGNTPEEASERYARGPRPKPTLHGPFPPAHAILWPRDRSGDKALAAQRRATAIRAVEGILAHDMITGWEPSYTAAVIVAQLSPGRIRRGITGPCVYCGTWLANTIDHVIPTAKGGTDDPPNIVSACHACNSRKADRTPEEWGVPA